MTRMAEWLKKADAVCFDVDSTVINTEGIDELADYFGAGEAVAKLTKEAMEGGMKFEDALDARHRRDQSAGILRSRETHASRSSAA